MEKKSLINKIKALFNEETTEESVEFVDVETQDGQILRVADVAVDQPVEIVEGENLVEAPDGNYVLVDGTTLVVSGGMITEIVEVEEDNEENNEEMNSHDKNKFTILQGVDKWQVEVTEESIEVGTKLTQVDAEGNTWQLSDGEYLLEDGTKIQVDSDGVVVLVGENSNEQMSAEEDEKKENDLDSAIINALETLTKEVASLKEGFSKVEAENKELKEKVEAFGGLPSEEHTETKKEFKAVSKKPKSPLHSITGY
jgi:hypothetical protein